MPIGIHEGSSVIVPDARLGPPVQPAGPARRVAPLRGDAGLRPAHRVRGARAPPGPALHLPRVLRRLGPVLARAPRRAGRVLRRLLPRPGAAPLGVLRPPVRHQLRGRRAHAARAGALRRATSASSGAATTRTTTPPSPAPSTPSAPPSPPAPPRPRPRCSGSTPGASTASRRAATRCRRPSSTTTSPPSPRRTPTCCVALFAPDAVFDVDGDRRRGHEAILALLHRAHLRLRGLPARARAAAGRRHHGDRRHRRPPGRGRAHGPRRLRDRRARASPRCASAASPTCCGPPDRR